MTFIRSKHNAKAGCAESNLKIRFFVLLAFLISWAEPASVTLPW